MWLAIALFALGTVALYLALTWVAYRNVGNAAPEDWSVTP